MPLWQLPKTVLMKLLLITYLSFFVFTLGYTQTDTFYIAPNQTNINYADGEDPHLVVINTANNINRLFLFLGGTGSNTSSYQNLCRFAGELGYEVINLSYLNSVAAASLANSSDNQVFRKYRQEVCYGTPESAAVEVDSLNSIYTRTINLINYLILRFPEQNWDNYLLDNNTLDWSKIVVGGHSQGAGHAGYFGKQALVARVLMFAGPNDYSDFFSTSATWLQIPGSTPLDKHFAYLSLLDEVVDFSKQLTNLEGLNLYPTYDTTFVDTANQPFNNSRCLYTTQPPGFAILHHNSPVRRSLINDRVWEYMLDPSTFTSVNNHQLKKEIIVYPNPTHSLLNIDFDAEIDPGLIKVYNLKGQLVSQKITGPTKTVSLDLSDLANGCYFIRINKVILKAIKN